MTPDVAKRVIEGALLCANRALAVNDLRQLFDEDAELPPDTVTALLDELREEWQGRSIELVSQASGWRFQCAADVARHVLRLQPERIPRYSRAVMETLAIIAYHQPVTRGDIEEIRGVGVSAHIIKTLEDRGWIDQVGVKEVPGRPALFATTRQFLDDLNLHSLKELPPLEVGEASAGLLELAEQTLPPIDVAVAVDGSEAAAEPLSVSTAAEIAEASADAVIEAGSATVTDEVGAVGSDAPEPREATLVESIRSEGVSADAAPDDGASVDVAPVDVAPVDVASVDVALVDVAPADAASAEAGSLETASLEAEFPEPAPSAGANSPEADVGAAEGQVPGITPAAGWHEGAGSLAAEMAAGHLDEAGAPARNDEEGAAGVAAQVPGTAAGVTVTAGEGERSVADGDDRAASVSVIEAGRGDVDSGGAGLRPTESVAAEEDGR